MPRRRRGLAATASAPFSSAFPLCDRAPGWLWPVVATPDSYRLYDVLNNHRRTQYLLATGPTQPLPNIFGGAPWTEPLCAPAAFPVPGNFFMAVCSAHLGSK